MAMNSQNVNWEKIEELIQKDDPMEPGDLELGYDGHNIVPCGNCYEEINLIWEFCPWCGQRIGRNKYGRKTDFI